MHFHPHRLSPASVPPENRRRGRTPLAGLLTGSLLVAGAIVWLLSPLGPFGREKRPSGVLLISIDSLRADHLSSYGYRSPTRPDIDTTPNIDRLLSDSGLRFTRAFSTTSWTLPAHVAMLTGQPDEIHGVRDLPDRLHESQPMLQEIFQRQGWRTFGIWSGPNLHPWFGFDRGFESYVDCSSTPVADPSVFVGDDMDEVMALHDTSHAGITGPAILKAFEEWWPTVARGERFFAFVHMWDVHYDYTPPTEHDVFFPNYDGDIDGREFRNLVLEPGDYDGLKRLISLYDAEIRYTDRNVGRILSLLDAAGRLDDTLVVFTADHGEEFLEHGVLGHKAGLYDEAIRVPLILRYPPLVPAGDEAADLVSLVDLAPTILDLCDIDAGSVMWGTSLVPTFDGNIPARALPLELTYRPIDIDVRGYRTEDFKVLRFNAGGPGHLIDLAVDPREQHIKKQKDLAPGDTRLGQAKEFWRELDRRAAEMQRVETGEMPATLVDDLQDAGYVGEDPDEPVEDPR